MSLNNILWCTLRIGHLLVCFPLSYESRKRFVLVGLIGMGEGVSDRCQEVSANTPVSLNLSNVIEAALKSNILELHFVCPVGNILASQKSPFPDAVFRGTDLLEKSKTKFKLISLLLK